MDFHLNSLLNLPNTTVFTCYKNAGFIFLHIQPTNDGLNCSNCQNYTDSVAGHPPSTVDQTSHVLIRDLSIKIILGGAANTLANHLPEIANYFLNRTTSGVTEGINTKIKLDVIAWLWEDINLSKLR